MNIEYIRKAQGLAQEAVVKGLDSLESGISEKQFADLLEKYMRDLGADNFWYPTLVRFEISDQRGRSFYAGRKYLPDDEIFFEKNELVYIAVHPIYKEHWGDYSVTVYTGDDPDIRKLVKDSLIINDEILKFATPEKTCDDMYKECDRLFKKMGYINADRPTTSVQQTIGHSLEFDPSDRIYLTYGEKTKLKGKVWTIEPRIARGEGKISAGFERLVSFMNNDKEVIGTFDEILKFNKMHHEIYS